MSYDQNFVALTGRFTRDPELTTLQSGKSVVKFTLAVGRGKDATDFWDCEAWERTADLVCEHVRKGDALTVHGQMTQQHWNDKETGAKRSKPVVRVDRIFFVPRNRRREEADAPSEGDGHHGYSEDVPWG